MSVLLIVLSGSDNIFLLSFNQWIEWLMMQFTVLQMSFTIVKFFTATSPSIVFKILRVLSNLHNTICKVNLI